MNTPAPRKPSELLKDLMNGLHPHEDATFIIKPSDREPIGTMLQMIDWLNQNGTARASFRAYQGQQKNKAKP